MRKIELTVRKAALRIAVEDRALSQARRSVSFSSNQLKQAEHLFQKELLKLRGMQSSKLPVRAQIGEGAFRGELLRSHSADFKASAAQLDQARTAQSVIAEKIAGIEKLQKQGEVQLQQHHECERMRREEWEVEELSARAPLDRAPELTVIGSVSLHEIEAAPVEVKQNPSVRSLETALWASHAPQLYSVTGELTAHDGASVTFTLSEQTPLHLNLVVNTESLDVQRDSTSLEDELNDAGYTVTRLQVEGYEPHVD